MSTVVPTKSALSFGGILNSEWIKLRSLRSPFWSYGVVVFMTIALGLLLSVTLDTGGAPVDTEFGQTLATQVATLGINFSQLVACVLGCLVITGEYGTGMIRSTLTAVPTRLPALYAKAIVFAVVTFVVSFVTIVITGLITAPLLNASSGVQVDFADPQYWLTLVGGAGYLALIGVFALAVGAIIRNSAGAIAIVLALILVVPTVLGLFAAITQQSWPMDVAAFLPNNAGALLFRYPTGQTVPDGSSIVLETWQALLVLLGWVAGTLALASVLLKRRDA